MATVLDFTTTDSAQPFRVAQLGQGPTVVLLHGFPDTPLSWHDTATHLVDQGFHVVVPFLRGYHRDTIVEGRGYSRAETGADVIALLDALDIERATLVGHDWGASCAWEAATQAPDRINGIVPIAIPHPSTLTPSPALAWEVRHFAALRLPGATKRLLKKRLTYIDTLYQRWSPNWTGVDQREAVARVKIAFGDERVFDHALAWYRALEFTPPSEPASKLACPALLVAGGSDFGGDLAPYRASLDLVGESSTLFVAEQAGHWPHREDSAGFHRALMDFLQHC